MGESSGGRMRVILCSIGIGGWYPRGISRLISTLHQHSPGYEIQAWVNTYPFGSPGPVVEDGVDYSGYCAKPFALAAARNSGADIAILCDAAFFAVRDIGPLVDHIARTGYYLCRNGNQVGHWSSDRCLERMNVSRADSFGIEEVSSYCVGLNFSDGRCTELLYRWCGYAADRLTFPGPHTAIMHDGRNRGFVSVDSRVRGHRHDQTALSILAHRLGMNQLSERPYLTAYKGSESAETVLCNEGMGS
jgi:hypothetical protein